MIPLRTEWQALTDTGLVREANEDRYFASDVLGLWAVADGMGGMARGDWAASQVVDALGFVVRDDDCDGMVAATAHAIHAANRVILTEAEAQGAQMGTTVVALVMRDRRFAMLWVGDSRGYLWRDRQLHRLTRDHSQVQELIDRGLLTPDEATRHPLRSTLTRAVGVTDPVLIDSISDTILPDDIFLLCSDGLHGVISEAEIAACLDSGDNAAAARALVQRSLESGAPDNVTLVMVAANESTLLQFGGIAPGNGI